MIAFRDDKMITHSKRQKQMCHATPLLISRNLWHFICLSLCNFMRRCWQGRLRWRSTIYLCVVMERARRQRRRRFPRFGFHEGRFRRPDLCEYSIRAGEASCAEGLFSSQASSVPVPPTPRAIRRPASDKHPARSTVRCRNK